MQSTQETALRFPCTFLPVDVFYNIARDMSTEDILSLARADPALEEVAEYYFRRRQMKLILNSYDDPRIPQQLIDFMAFIRNLFVCSENASMNERLTQFLAKCTELEELHIYGLFQLGAAEVDDRSFAKLRKLTLDMESVENVRAICDRLHTGNLHTICLAQIHDYGQCLPFLPLSIRHLELDLGYQTNPWFTALQSYLAANRGLRYLGLESLSHEIHIVNLVEHLQELQHLIVSGMDHSHVRNCGSLASLPNLVSLVVSHMDEQQFDAYLKALRPDAHYRLQKLHIYLPKVDFERVALHKLGELQQLQDVSITFGDNVSNMPCLQNALSRWTPRLRKLQIGSFWIGRPLSAEWVANSFPCLQTLEMYLLPAGLARLADLPELRELNVVINLQYHLGKVVLQWRQNAEVTRMMISLSQHKVLKRLSIGTTTGVLVRLSDRAIRDFGKWPALREMQIIRFIEPEDLVKLRRTTRPEKVLWGSF